MKRRVLFVLASLPLFTSMAFGQVNTLPPMTAIDFAPGTTTSTVTGQLSPGGRNVYSVSAKAGQTLSLSVASGPAGVTFQVFRFDATLEKGPDGLPVVTGRTLPDAGATDNAKAWIGAVPQDGSYFILVGQGSGAGAPAPYSLIVSLQ